MEPKPNAPEDRPARPFDAASRLAPRRAAAPGAQTPFESAQPRYLAVAERLSQAITQGDYGIGSLLPTESELCEKFGVSRHTVREALRKLRDLGLVTRHQGVGTRVENAEISGRYVASLNTIQDMWRHVEKTQPKVVYKAVERKGQALFSAAVLPRRRHLAARRRLAQQRVRPEAACPFRCPTSTSTTRSGASSARSTRRRCRSSR
jgi:DNA-binding GntR family transcriptional regulator